MTAIAWAQRGVGRLEPPDRDAALAFAREHYGPDSPQADPRHFRWLFEDVPWPDADGVQLWVCKRNDAIVGQQGGIPFRLKVGDRTRRATWGIDLMVAPEWRLRGVGPALAEAHANASEVAVTLGMSEPAYKSYKRSGWMDLGAIPTYVRPIDPVRCLEALGRGGGGLRLAARFAGPVLRTATASAGLAVRALGARLSTVERFDSRVDALWSAAAPQHGVIAERSLPFLRWRFDESPWSGRFHRLYVTRGPTLMGYAVLRLDQRNGVPVAVVVDYLTRPGWMLPVFLLVTGWAQGRGSAAVVCRSLDGHGHRPLTALGYLCLKNGLKYPTRLMVRPGPGGEDTRPVLEDRANWMVTAADSDIGFKELG